jgi:aspartyl-tRNA(Asn)/glutamyl-tRNA(Gln) amidotransferase subunit A
MDAALAGCDALMLPTLPIAAPLIGAETMMIGDRQEPVRALMLRLTQLFNVTGHPVISIPCGVTSNRLPCGLQLVGGRNQTAALVSLAEAVENILSV